MKKMISKVMMPFAVFALAIGGAFATNTSNQQQTSAEIVGYIYNAGVCEQPTRCSNIPGPACKWESQTVFAMNGTDCILPAYHLDLE